MNILEINNLTKFFGEKKALDNVSFSVEKGSICGLLGPNGAGKTTILRILNGIMVSDSGSVTLNGKPVNLDTAADIGYMPEERGLYENMKVEEQLMYFGLLKGAPKKRLREVMKEYMEIFNLYDDRRRKVKELSKGNQQKVQIISTLVHEPSLVVLDEPFSGFDPINGQLLQTLVKRLREKDATIILSSHNMPAIEEMCTDIALINNGKLLVKDSIENIKESFKDNSLLVTTTTPLNIDLLKDEGVVAEISEERPANWRKGYGYRIFKKEGTRNTDLLDAIAMQSEITHFEEALPTLNEIFLTYTG